MNVLIIEDEPLAAERLEKLVKEIQPGVTISAKIDSVKKSVEWFKVSSSPDLILMDIQLADGLSFKIFEECEVKSPVIFTTAYDEYALKAFKVNSIDYILKPIDKNELATAFKKYDSLTSTPKPEKMMESIGYAMQMLTKKYKERFVIKIGEHFKNPWRLLTYCFSIVSRKQHSLRLKDGRKYILDFTMDQLDGLIDPKRFFRINRKYIVAVDSIQDMISYTNSRLKLVLKTSDDDDVVVARERVQEFKYWLDQ